MFDDFEICEQLRSVDRQQLLDCLDFHNDRVFHEQIHPVAQSQLKPFVVNRQMHLPFETQAQLAQFVTEAFLICGLQQPRPRCR